MLALFRDASSELKFSSTFSHDFDGISSIVFSIFHMVFMQQLGAYFGQRTHVIC